HRRLCGAVVVCRYGSARTDTVVHRHSETPAATAETRPALSQSLLKNHGIGLSTCCSSASPEYTLSPIKSNTGCRARISSLILSQSHAKRGTSLRCTHTHIYQLQPAINSELIASFPECKRCAPSPWCRTQTGDDDGTVRKIRGTLWQQVYLTRSEIELF